MRYLMVILAVVVLTGCAGQGSMIKADFHDDGSFKSVEATGDTLLTINKETGEMEFLTEQVKAETVSIIGEQLQALWGLLGTK